MQTSTHETITVPDGSTLHVTTYGTPSPSLPSLIFLHYYGGSPASWAQVIQHKVLEPYHKVLYHARGWPPSTGPEDPEAYSVAAMSSDLAAVISASALDKHEASFIVVGHSMGGKVAQHYAATLKPPSLRGLLLVAPAPLYGVTFPEDVKQQQLSAYQSRENIIFVLDNVLTAGPGSLSPGTVVQCVTDSLRGNQHAKAAWPKIGMGEEFGNEAKEVKVPVLALRGDKDFEGMIVGPLGLEHGWGHRTIEKCGHLIPLEQPEALARELVAFVRGVASVGLTA